MSLPSWERGLKFRKATVPTLLSSVAPLVGAWIEIRDFIYYSVPRRVAPLVGAWIEIDDDEDDEEEEAGRSPRGSVD